MVPTQRQPRFFKTPELRCRLAAITFLAMLSILILHLCTSGG